MFKQQAVNFVVDILSHPTGVSSYDRHSGLLCLVYD